MAFTENLAPLFSTDDFGVTALFTPDNGGAASNANGIFENAYYETDGETIGVEGSRPHFTCASADVASIVEGDHITISGSNYDVLDVEPDGTGVTTFRLEPTGAIVVAGANQLIFAGEISGTLSNGTIFGGVAVLDDGRFYGGTITADTAPGSNCTIDIVNVSNVAQSKVLTLTTGSKFRKTTYVSNLSVTAGDTYRLQVTDPGNAAARWISVSLMFHRTSA